MTFHQIGRQKNLGSDGSKERQWQEQYRWTYTMLFTYLYLHLQELCTQTYLQIQLQLCKELKQENFQTCFILISISIKIHKCLFTQNHLSKVANAIIGNGMLKLPGMKRFCFTHLVLGHWKHMNKITSRSAGENSSSLHYNTHLRRVIWQ